MTRDRAARLALVLILVTGLLVSRRFDPRRRRGSITAASCPFGGGPKQLVEKRVPCTRIVAILGIFFSFFCYPLPGVAFLCFVIGTREGKNRGCEGAR